MKKAALKELEGSVATVRFTGASGGTSYSYEGGKATLGKGETVRVTLKGHWLALLASGNAEIAK
ncbi:MAG: hypothetical protein JW990_11995 [Thermoleophilia bacterium]|nr:hypothetical protein [Thermoleophilia bacterium]